MPVTTKVVTNTLPQATSGTADFTSSGFGTPSAAIIYLHIANTTNSPQDTLQQGVAFWDGTSLHGHSSASNDNQNPSDTSRQASTSAAVNGPGGLTYTVANITDGIRLTKTGGTTGVDRYCTVVLFGGLTNAYVGSKLLGTSTSIQDITDPGFKPDMIFTCGINHTAATVSSLVDEKFCFGVVHNSATDTVTQAAMSIFGDDNVTPTDVSTFTTHSYGFMNYDGTSMDYGVSFSAFDASGFSITIASPGGRSHYMSYLAIELDDPDNGYVDIIDIPASTGSDAHTGVGFTPEVLSIATVGNTSLDSKLLGGRISFGFTDGTTHAGYWGSDQDNVATSNSVADYSSSNMVVAYTDAGAADAVGAYSSFDADGYTLTYSDAAASALKALAWAVTGSADTASPTLSTAAIPSAGTTIVLTYDEALDAGSVPAITDFTLTTDAGDRATPAVDTGGVAVAGSAVTLTLDRTIDVTETITVSYTAGANPIQDAATNAAANLSSQAVTNNSTQIISPNNPGNEDTVTLADAETGTDSVWQYVSEIAASGDYGAFPSSYAGGTITAETSVGGNLTGRFSVSAGTGNGSFTVDYYDASAGTWDSIVVTTADGSISTYKRSKLSLALGLGV